MPGSPTSALLLRASSFPCKDWKVLDVLRQPSELPTSGYWPFVFDGQCPLNWKNTPPFLRAACTVPYDLVQFTRLRT
jgi:hypothetical protein